MRTAIIGSTGEVEEVLRLGPSTLRRFKRWNDAPRMAALFRQAGYNAYINHPLDNTLDDPDLWVISDVPRAVLVGSGLHARITETVLSGRARILALGGCFGFSGAQGSGGWGDDPILPVVCALEDDTCERVGGIVATAKDNTSMPGWTSFGFNRVTARKGTEIFAWFEDAPALVMNPDKRRVSWSTGLFPHWGPRLHERAGIIAWLAMLYTGENTK